MNDVQRQTEKALGRILRMVEEMGGDGLMVSLPRAALTEADRVYVKAWNTHLGVLGRHRVGEETFTVTIEEWQAMLLTCGALRKLLNNFDWQVPGGIRQAEDD